MSDILVLQVVVIACGTISFVATLRFVQRSLELRTQRRISAGSTDRVGERLDRIESIVEATAVEVERIAEANRFISKLLADRSGPSSSPSRSERVITPH